MVSLQAGKSGPLFNIHGDLLGSKCKTIISAFQRGFEEAQKGVYTFQDTSAGTLGRFIEWAYTGDYPAVLSATTSALSETKEAENAGDKIEEEDGGRNRIATEGIDLVAENHPLLAHIQLYIFCIIYLIPDLQQLAFEKLSTCLIDLEKPDNLSTQLAVIAALRVAFLRLPPQDPLLDWLAQYAAYCVDELRLQKDFLDLLSESPLLSSRMILSLNPGSSPPWKTKTPKYFYAPYSPGENCGDYAN